MTLAAVSNTVVLNWQDHVKNVDIHVADTTGLPNITDIINKKRHAPFGHVVRLDASVPAHQVLKQVIAMKRGRCSGMNWRRPLQCKMNDLE